MPNASRSTVVSHMPVIILHQSCRDLPNSNKHSPLCDGSVKIFLIRPSQVCRICRSIPGYRSLHGFSPLILHNCSLSHFTTHNNTHDNTHDNSPHVQLRWRRVLNGQYRSLLSGQQTKTRSRQKKRRGCLFLDHYHSPVKKLVRTVLDQFLYL